MAVLVTPLISVATLVCPRNWMVVVYFLIPTLEKNIKWEETALSESHSEIPGSRLTISD